MAETISPKSYITIQGWMITDLHLSGNDLLVYAIIYGFSQDDKSEFCGSRQYLADWCNSSVRGIQKNINNLIEMGLIEQTEVQPGKYVKYKANKVGTKFTGEQSSPLPVNKVHGGSEQSSRDNIDYNIDYNIDNIIINNNTDQGLFQENDNVKSHNVVKRKIPNLNINDDVNTKSYNDDTTNQKKEKKLNLYQKIMLEIDTRYAGDDKLIAALKDYVSVRLTIKDKPIRGIAQWKGMLNTLDSLQGDKVAIVRRAIERGWASFFELKDFNYSRKTGYANNGNQTDYSVFGETEEIAHGSVRPETVEGGGFSGHVF